MPKRHGPANKFSLTPVKRSHLVSTSGVGSLIRLRNGATALVAGLQAWEDAIRLPAAANPGAYAAAKDAFLEQYLIRDPELEVATGVAKFYQPPRAPGDGDFGAVDAWQIPAVVFPRSAICENFRCGSVRTDMRDSGALPECSECDPVAAGRRRRPHRKRQSPIFLVCSEGHISDIDWSTEVEHTPECTGADMQVTTSVSIHSPRLKCRSCNAQQRLTATRPCNGARSWLPNVPHEPCSASMHVVDRTSVQVYFAQTKSSIHVPPRSGIDPGIVDWILNRREYRFLDPGNPAHVTQAQKDLRCNGKDLSVEDVKLHLNEALSSAHRPGEEQEWDPVMARAHELDVFTNAVSGFQVRQSDFLEFHDANLTGTDPNLFGPGALIDRVVCLTRMTETRVQDGFTRYTPSSVAPIVGFQRMWGHRNHSDGWLPAYRAYGEGILLVFNHVMLQDKLGARPATAGEKQRPTELSPSGAFAHSLAHLIMVRLANDCGYALPAIRDRIYDLPDGRVAALVYTAESDIMGTLGGLVEFGEGSRIEELVVGAIDDAHWCSQDPVCRDQQKEPTRGRGACCHQCLYVPETSCEARNEDLDRRLIHLILS